MKKSGSEEDLQKDMEKGGFRGGLDPPESSSRYSESSIQHFPTASRFGAKSGTKTIPKSRFWGYFGALGWFFGEKRRSKKRPKKREVKNEVQGVMPTIDGTMVGPRVSP